jgi:hypothetical protein
LELVSPLTKEIASSWAKVFESDLFGPMEKSIISIIEKLIKEVEQTSPVGLKDRCKAQGLQSIEEAQVAMKALMGKVQEQMSNEQKEISRCVAPHVRDLLLDGYEEAMLERGIGSVARQKVSLYHLLFQSCQTKVTTRHYSTTSLRILKTKFSLTSQTKSSIDWMPQLIQLEIAWTMLWSH